MLYCKGTVCKFGCKTNSAMFFCDDDDDNVDDDDDDFNNLTLAFAS